MLHFKFCLFCNSNSIRLLVPLLLCFLLIFSDIFSAINAIPFGRKRRRRDGLLVENDASSWEFEERSCEALCDAQFGRNFEEEFGRSYVTQFFDFPIDPLLSSSRLALQNFCRLVKERSCCLRDECLMESVPPSPQTFICLEHRDRFEQALQCLNSTNAHFKFHAACSNAAKRSIDIDQELYETHGFSEPQTEQYHQQDLRCRFQFCTLQARLLLIEQHCQEVYSREQSRKTVTDYYVEDLELDLAEYGEPLNGTKHFPRFCATFLAQQRGLVSHQLSESGLTTFEREAQILLEAVGANRKWR